MNTSARRMSKKMAILLAVAFALALVAPFGFAQEAPPEEESWYGDKGTFEVGLNGSITLPTHFKYSGTGAPDDGDDGTTTIMLSPFASYFFMDHMHAGARLIYISSKTDTETEELETRIIFIYPTVGYTLALAPKFQIDASLNLGYSSITFDDGTDKYEYSQLSYGFSAMLLSPLTESAVLGIGIIVSWYKPDLEGVEYDVTYRSMQIPIQVSFYF